ncbi:ABC transporter permease [Staphylococcus sp. NRL 18/288]|nr:MULTISPECIES: ABC transporter permease [unclassified Staphylococcus]MCJ1655397.1 ABC transporter permease [Staphylococcus sp. NRL 21/187]MCJ1661232.1 ABC transporter permease [Staphylococcus sp. NRL 18/288]
MITFLKNEFVKIKSERFILVVILLSLIPFTMNIANFFLNNRNLSLENGFYFRFYNQYFMLGPIVVGIIATSVFYIEYKNHTLLNWLTYSRNKFRLFLSKFLIIICYCFVIYLINLGLILALYLINNIDFIDLVNIFISFTLLNLLLTIFLIPLSIFTLIMFNHYIISIVITIGITLLSMILIPAPFASLIPTTLSYRFSIGIISSSMSLDSLPNTLIGITILILLSISMTYLSLRQLKVN